MNASPAATTTAAAPTTTAATTAPPSMPETGPQIDLYFLRGGKVAAVGRPRPATQAVARTALQQLLAGLTDGERRLGFTTGVGPNRIERLTISNGVATLDTAERLRQGPELAQIVYTLTQFPTIKRVSVVLETNDAVELSRTDFEDLTPPILIESPTPGAVVESPIGVRGTANTFEATLYLDLVKDGRKLVSQQLVTASSGSGTRGTFAAKLRYDLDAPGPATLVAYEIDASSGKRTHVVELPLTLLP
jgi:hypothetical protein